MTEHSCRAAELQLMLPLAVSLLQPASGEASVDEDKCPGQTFSRRRVRSRIQSRIGAESGMSVQPWAPCVVPSHAILWKQATFCSCLLAFHEKQCPLQFFLSGLFIETRQSKKCSSIGNRTWGQFLPVWQFSPCDPLPATAYSSLGLEQ